jgi:transcriptional regulator with XRE-family HTH domain
MDMIGRIRRLHSRGKKSEREIARMTGLSRNTVSKWLHGEVDGPPKYRRSEHAEQARRRSTTTLKQALKADARRPRHERRTARRCMPRSRRGLRRRLQPRDRLHPRLAPGRRPIAAVAKMPSCR